MRSPLASVAALVLAPVLACSLAACSAPHATVVRNLGIGLVAEGALVTAGAYVTRDTGEGIADAAGVGGPLLATGLAAWIVGAILAGADAPRTP